jgi:hypothetical protein
LLVSGSYDNLAKLWDIRKWVFFFLLVTDKLLIFFTILYFQFY